MLLLGVELRPLPTLSLAAEDGGSGTQVQSGGASGHTKSQQFLRLASGDSIEAVPVVRSGGVNGIHLSVVNDPAKVGEAFWLLAGDFRHRILTLFRRSR